MIAKQNAVEEIQPGREMVEEFAIDSAAMAAYAALSGDRNPIHLDDDFARKKGFQGRVVYAGLIVAAVSRVLGMRLPGRDGLWTGVNLSFRAPLYLGQTARLVMTVVSVSPATGMITLDVRTTAADHLIATGRVETIVLKP